MLLKFQNRPHRPEIRILSQKSGQKIRIELLKRLEKKIMGLCQKRNL